MIILVFFPLLIFQMRSVSRAMEIMALVSPLLNVLQGVASFQDHVPVALEPAACSITSFVEGPWSIITLTFCNKQLDL